MTGDAGGDDGARGVRRTPRRHRFRRRTRPGPADPGDRPGDAAAAGAAESPGAGRRPHPQAADGAAGGAADPGPHDRHDRPGRAAAVGPGGAHRSTGRRRPRLDHRDADERLDDLELRGPRKDTGILATRVLPALERPRRALSFLVTSPGRLSVAAVVLIVAILAAGLSMAGSTSGRQERLHVMSVQSEPLAHAAQNLYSALSVADASANTAFSRGPDQSSAGLRRDYDDAIAQAALAGTRAAAGITDVDSPQMGDISTIQRLVPVYTGLVESARANTRQGHPVGVSYLAEASALMQERILPAAAELYRGTSAAVARERPALTGLPWVPLSGLAAAILMLVVAQWRLTRRTRRLLNPGLASATALLAVAVLGVGATTLFAWRGEETLGSAPPVELLTEARISAQQTRATETLDLVHRRAGGEEEFGESADRIEKLLVDAADRSGAAGDTIGGARDAAILDASRALSRWRVAHDRMAALIDAGDYDAATAVATGIGVDGASSARSFAELDSSLQDAIAESRNDLRTRIENARVATAGMSAGVVALTILAAVGVAVGFRQPLLEFL